MFCFRHSSKVWTALQHSIPKWSPQAGTQYVLPFNKINVKILIKPKRPDPKSPATVTFRLQAKHFCPMRTETKLHFTADAGPFIACSLDLDPFCPMLFPFSRARMCSS
ncbi:hypothetical protein NPIL_468791 [Nephila pilipes]|uniref:Uncharacterized protein n=1 Tax=Nephila pilipes TaxID=299642 RepID=A0A8X6MZ80_NEPPI|nr:hypothetical protein NPIL_468791 [Nephila pilipes]